MERNSGTSGNSDRTEAGKDERREEFERDLRVILTTTEVAERADRAAHLLSQRDNREEMAKAAQKHAKSEIAELDAQIRRLSNEVRDKATYSPVKCERVYDYRLGRVTEVRTDTGEQISERAMSPEERQMAFNPGRKDDDDRRGGGSGDLDDDFGDDEKE